MRTLFGLILLATAAMSADKDYDGRWDITAIQQRPRAWWAELTGVGTPNAAGKFVSAYAGDMNKINEIKVENGELVFTIIPPAQANKAAPKPMVYRARLVGGKLEGTMQVEGQSAPPTKWTGVRAPVIQRQRTTVPGKKASRSNSSMAKISAAGRRSIPGPR